MRAFLLILELLVFTFKVVTVVLRLAVVLAPLYYLHVILDPNDEQFIRESHPYLWTFVWMFVSPFVLFFPEIWAATPAGGRSSGSAVYSDGGEDARHLDFMTKGTPEYLAFHHGDPTPEVTAAHCDD